MRTLIVMVNGGMMYRFRYDPDIVDDRLYVLRQIEDVCKQHPHPPFIIHIWYEEDW